MRPSKGVVFALLAAMLLICGSVATRGAQQAGSTDQSDSNSTATKKKSKKKAAADASQSGTDASADSTKTPKSKKKEDCRGGRQLSSEYSGHNDHKEKEPFQEIGRRSG